MADYYDVLEFMGEAQKVPCTFLFDIPNSGHLEGNSEKHLRQGTAIELAFWLAGPLQSRDMLNLNLPKPYTTRIRNALDASATSVNLRNLGGGGGAFYAGGIRLEALIVDETLAPTLNEAFKTRVIEVMDQSQHTSADAGGEGAAYEFCQSLDSWERELFVTGEASAKAMKSWHDIKAKKA